MKPLVISHPRSGSHLLAHLIWTHLLQTPPQRFERPRVGHWSRRGDAPTAVYQHPDGTCTREGQPLEIPYAALLGGHGFTPPSARYIYLYRDFGPLAQSWYRFIEFHHKDRAQQSFERFLRSPVDIAGSPGQRGRARNPAAHHVEHMRKHCASSKALVVSYELVVANPEAELCRIAEAFDLPDPGRVKLPTAPIGWQSGLTKPD